MIEEICKNLADLDDKYFARYAYDREPINGKLSFEQYYEQYYLKAVEEGKIVAKDFAGKSINQIVEELGAEIEMLPMQDAEAIYNFAMFIEPNRIQIYRENLLESQEVIDSLIDERYQGINLREVILAHEIFHMLQSRYPDLFILKPHIKLWQIFKFENVSRLVSLEEVAAMSFARELLQLKINPYCLDVVMCMSRAPQRAKSLYNYYMELKEGAEQ